MTEQRAGAGKTKGTRRGDAAEPRRTKREPRPDAGASRRGPGEPRPDAGAPRRPTSERRRDAGAAGGRALRRVLLILVVAITVGAAIGFFLHRFEIGSILVKTVQSGGSQSVLLQRRDIGEIETLAYVRRTVFPHDYLSTDLTMEEITARIAEFSAPPEEVLTPEALRHFRAANLAAEVGLATRREQASYVVVTTEYRFGYRVSDLIPVVERIEPIEGSASSVATTLAKLLPPPEMLSVSTNDIDPERYPYGRVPLDAAEWRSVAEFVRENDVPADEWERLVERSRETAAHIVLELIGPIGTK